MSRDQLTRLKPAWMAVVAILLSLLCVTAVYIATRILGDSPTPNPEPDQPATDTPITETPPPHFTEEMIIPGITETGMQILEDDDTEGRSPGGV